MQKFLSSWQIKRWYAHNQIFPTEDPLIWFSRQVQENSYTTPSWVQAVWLMYAFRLDMKEMVTTITLLRRQLLTSVPLSSAQTSMGVK
jgi:hypothetical protein